MGKKWKKLKKKGSREAESVEPPACDRRRIYLAALLVALTLLAYMPALSAGYIWDDDDYVTRNMTLRDLDGLGRIWLEPTSIPQYYPMVHTSFWVEYQLWKLKPLGYHLVNVLLHIANALLIWRLLLRLKVPGAFAAALIFALHPVHVESVAWITERKNVLSAFFFLLSLLAYLRYDPLDAGQERPQDGRGKMYAVSLGLFIAALLSKSVTVSLPAVILLLIWWRRGRVTVKDVIPLVPMFAVGIIASAGTILMERYHVGAAGVEWELSFMQRVMIAGRALWFYAGKLLWPHPLVFNYPRWNMDTSWTGYLFPVSVLFVYAALWALRGRIGRGPLVGVLAFSGVLFPALGFIDVYPMRYSFVADHFQYLASVALITLAVSAVAAFVHRQGGNAQRIVPALAVIVILPLAVLTYRQTRAYENAETLWLDTIAKNPRSWMAYYHMGWIRAGEGRLEEAERYYREAIRFSAPPNRHHHMAMNNLAQVLRGQGKMDEAEAYYQKALETSPDFQSAMSNLGGFLRDQGRCGEAVDYLTRAVDLEPGDADARNNLGSALACTGQHDEAVRAFQQALETDPGHAAAHFNLANAFGRQGKYDLAEEHFDAVVRNGLSEPGRISALANGYVRLGRDGKAAFLYRQLLELRPEDGAAMASLAWILATSPDEEVRDGAEALRLARAAEEQLGKSPGILDVVAAAHAEEAQFDLAVRAIEEALKLETQTGTDAKVDPRVLRQRLKLYRARKPLRLASRPPGA